MMNRLALCVMTHNHPDIIDSLYTKVLDAYNDYGIDVYLYDSSTNGETYDVYKRLRASYSNIYYVDADFPVDEGGNKKIYNCLRGFGHKNEYEYIMPIKDRIGIEPETLTTISDAIEDGYDVIILSSFYHNNILEVNQKQEEYNNAIELFRDEAVNAINWQTCLFSTKFLAGVDWERIYDEYGFEGTTELGQCFQQLIILFDTLSRCSVVNVKVIPRENVRIFSASREQVLSGWYKKIMPIWFELWPKSIMSLPSCYDEYKYLVIKEETNVPAILGNIFQIKNHIEKGNMTKDDIKKLLTSWSSYSDIPKEYIELLLENKKEAIREKFSFDLNAFLAKEEYEKAYKLFMSCAEYALCSYEKEIYRSVYLALMIYRQEYNSDIQNHFLCNVHSVLEIYLKYRNVKSFLRKMHYGVCVDESVEYMKYITEKEVSKLALEMIIVNNIA